MGPPHATTCIIISRGGSHAAGTIQTNDFPIEEIVLNDGLHELGILLRVTQPTREGHGGCQGLLGFIWEVVEDGGMEVTRGDGHDSYAQLGQVTGQGQGHPHHRTFGCRIGHL